MRTEPDALSALSGSAVLVLADGAAYHGAAFGARCVRSGEVCFNTSMTGYQEILTDPSYAGQLVTMTYPQIGNVGVNLQDEESSAPRLSGFVIRELCEQPSNWRAQEPLGDYLLRHDIPGIADIDTRALVRRIRSAGFQNGVISTDPERQDVAELVQLARTAPSLEGRDLPAEVSCREPYRWTEGSWLGVQGQLPRAPRPTERFKLVAFDFGIKQTILRLLTEQGFDVEVVPANTTAAQVDAVRPDAVFLSNGPGDPAAVAGAAATVSELAARYPVFGICLGHQILARALGATTHKLKFGHHGGNQPGQDLHTGRVAICAENHGYAVDADSLRAIDGPVEVTHINLNDQTVEGLAHATLPVFSVQYHPEASPGPHDASYFFARFRELVRRHKGGEAVSGMSITTGQP